MVWVVQHSDCSVLETIQSTSVEGKPIRPRKSEPVCQKTRWGMMNLCNSLSYWEAYDNKVLRFCYDKQYYITWELTSSHDTTAQRLSTLAVHYVCSSVRHLLGSRYLANMLVSLLSVQSQASLWSSETMMFHKHAYSWKASFFLLLVQLRRTTCRPMYRYQRHWQCSSVASRLTCLLYLTLTELLRLLG